jgi:hypothetical protein
MKRELLLFGELILEGEKAKELASWAILKYKVELLFILEAFLKLHKKGVIKVAENTLLVHDVLLLVLLHDIFLLQNLHRIDLFVLFTPHKQHLCIGASPDH